LHEEVQKFLSEGGFFDPDDPRLEQQRREAWAAGHEIAKMHADVFNTPAGQRLMRHWIAQFYAYPIVRPGQDAYAQGIREGRADLVRQVLVQLELARRGPPAGA
jgi:hypothetical protein